MVLVFCNCHIMFCCSGDHDFIVDEIKAAAQKVDEVVSVSEVQVYYKDNGDIAAKLDIVLHAEWTIQQAHWIAGNGFTWLPALLILDTKII